MFDITVYQNACEQLRLDTETLEEMIAMTENQNQVSLRRPARIALVTAALVAALGITASAAELPVVQQFFAKVFVTVAADDGVFTGIVIPTMAVEERDGRTILILDGEEMDVTEALAKDGEYIFEGEGYQVRVDAEGVAWLVAYDPKGDIVLSLANEAGSKGDTAVYNVISDTDGEVKEGVYAISDTTDSVDVFDADGENWNYRAEDSQTELSGTE